MYFFKEFVFGVYCNMQFFITFRRTILRLGRVCKRHFDNPIRKSPYKWRKRELSLRTPSNSKLATHIIVLYYIIFCCVLLIIQLRSSVA